MPQNVRVRRGTEGPRHDPWSYTEVSVTRLNGDKITMHCGLAVWLKINGEKFNPDIPKTLRWDIAQDEYEAALFAEFERRAGMSYHRADRFPDFLEERYMRQLSPKDRECYIMVREADAALLRYAQ